MNRIGISFAVQFNFLIDWFSNSIILINFFNVIIICMRQHILNQMEGNIERILAIIKNLCIDMEWKKNVVYIWITRVKALK